MNEVYKKFIEIQNKTKEQEKYKNYENEDFVEEITKLQQENQQLKEVIEEVRKYTKDNLNINQLIQYDLLQILDKAKENKWE